MKTGKSISDKSLDIIIVIIYLMFSLICIYPFYYLIINTISANDLSARGAVMFFPKEIHFTNYKALLSIPGFGNAALISVGRTVLGTLGSLLGASFLGYMFTQQDMLGRKFWYRFTVITMYVSAGLIPYYLTMLNLHLTNNFLAYILPAVVQPFYIVLVKTYVESTPKALQEAARIDGAGTLRIFGSVVLPICKPILATVAIFAAVGQWNSFQDTLLLMTDSKLYTLQYILYQYINQANSLAAMIKSSGSASVVQNLATQQTSTSVRMTVTVVVVLPILLIYPIFQKFFVSGIMLGSVKG